MALIGSGGCESIPPEQNPVRVHSIDRDVWVDPQPIKWPGSDRGVHAIFDVTESFSICGNVLTDSAKSSIGAGAILFGRVCGKLVVLLPPTSSMNTELTRRMAAAHEAFHHAIQYNSLLPRFDLAGFVDLPSKQETLNIHAYAREIFDLLLTDPGPTSDVCARILSGYKALRPVEREYLGYKIYWEWPAEFYMREAVFTNSSFEEYRVKRKKMTREGWGEDFLYMAGVLAIERIETSMPRKDWQRRYMTGASIFNLLAESLGCEPFDPPSFQVRSLTLPDIFTAGRD